VSEAKYEVTFLSPSYDDLAAALTNIGRFSSKAADTFMDDLDRQTGYLETMPKMYAVDEDHPPYRRMVLKDYLVFYFVDEPRKMVEIYRILPARMDLNRYFVNAGNEH
jgi:plasmid stabilization system protein ParE